MPASTPLHIPPMPAGATALQHDACRVIDAPDDRIQAASPRIRGWQAPAARHITDVTAWSTRTRDT